MIRKILLSILVGSFPLFVGCGYHHAGEGEDIAAHFPVISVPYFLGDRDGLLTDAVVKKLCASGMFQYIGHEGGGIVLKGEVIGDSFQHIGYRYDRYPISGLLINRLVPSEGRREISVRISLIDPHCQKVVYGPFDISAAGDCDFSNSDSLQDSSFVDRAGLRRSLLSFSLGQLDSEQGAHAATLTSIYEQLAVKIVEGISYLSYNLPAKG